MNKTYNTEAELERQLIEELNASGYERIILKNMKKINKVDPKNSDDKFTIMKDLLLRVCLIKQL